MRLAWILILLITGVCGVFAEESTFDSEQVRYWFLEASTGGGAALFGSVKNTSIWIVGARFGINLANRLEYNAEIAPAFLVFQDSSSPYGFSVTPVLIKANLTRIGKWIPYVEGGAGMLFTSSAVPDGSSKFNFTPQAGAGLQIFFKEKRSVRLGLRYMHISNGGLASPNPGIDTMQFVVGYQWFR